MEYRINKIDPELRHSINEERAEGKVHNKKGINVNKDKQETKEDIAYKNSKGKNKKNIKNNGIAGKEEKKIEDPYRGHYIDIRR